MTKTYDITDSKGTICSAGSYMDGWQLCILELDPDVSTSVLLEDSELLMLRDWINGLGIPEK